MSLAPALKHVRIGRRIRLAREAKGLSQEAFAERIGTSRRHVMRLERGQHKPSAPMLRSITEITGVSLEDLIADDDEESDPVDFAAAIELLIDRAVSKRVRSELQRLGVAP